MHCIYRYIYTSKSFFLTVDRPTYVCMQSESRRFCEDNLVHQKTLNEAREYHRDFIRKLKRLNFMYVDVRSNPVFNHTYVQLI
jgi:hypothetical protein